MFAYNPTVNDTSGQILAQGQINAADTTARANMQLGDDISSSLLTLASAYGKKRDKKELLAGMDKSVDAMSDMGAVTSDFYEKYMNAPEIVRPFLFDAVASPMFKSYTAGQSAAAQAQAWQKYGQNQGGGGGGGQPNPYTY
jgi:phage-related minor tail protein